MIYTVYSDPDDNPEFAAKSSEPLPEIPLPEKQHNIKRTKRHQKIEGQGNFQTAAKPAASIKAQDNGQLRHRLACLLSPSDVARGYEILQMAAEEVDYLCRKLSSGRLTEEDLVRLRAKFAAQRHEKRL